MAVCLARNNGPRVYALRHYACLLRCRVNPLPLAKDRDACTPSPAKADPTDAALHLELLLTPRATLTPLTPHSPAMRALAQLVEPRRRLVGDTVRRTHRLTSALKHDCPHVLHWVHANDPTLFGAVLRPWPTRNAAPLARRSTLERFCRAPHVRDADVIDRRLQALKRATPLPTAEGLIAPTALLVHALVSPLRVTLQASAAFDHAMAPHAQSPPDCPVVAALPGAGAVFAPRLLAAFGEPRERYTAADALPKSAGIAPVTARRGTTAWGPWRLQCPTFRRQTVVEWAAESLRPSFGARADSEQQRHQGTSQQAAVRARAFTWSRILFRWWQHRTPEEEAVYRSAWPRRGSPLMHHLARGA